MAFSDQLDSLDAAVREHLTDPAELRPVGGGEASIVPVQIDEPMAPPSGFAAPVLQASITVAVVDGRPTVGQVYVPGRYIDDVFVPGDRAWKVTGAPTRSTDGRWWTAGVERAAP